jgi:uncharacterized protein YdbL (DUF1318 family)
MKKIVRVGFVFLLITLISCVTVNLYFPAAEMKKAADTMVDEEFKGTTPEKPKQSSRFYNPMIRISFGPSVAFAADVDLNISTPAIRALKDSLKTRFQLLKPWLDKGVIGHNNRGYLEIRDTTGLSLKEKAELTALVNAQNRDRKALYGEILSANKLDPNKINQVEKVFADSRREKSHPGWWIQDDNGQWIKK